MIKQLIRSWLGIEEPDQEDVMQALDDALNEEEVQHANFFNYVGGMRIACPECSELIEIDSQLECPNCNMRAEVYTKTTRSGYVVDDE